MPAITCSRVVLPEPAAAHQHHLLAGGSLKSLTFKIGSELPSGSRKDFWQILEMQHSGGHAEV